MIGKQLGARRWKRQHHTRTSACRRTPGRGFRLRPDEWKSGDHLWILIGADGPDALTGGKGDDLLIGGDGKDTFTSSKGHDIAFGGKGDDTFKALAADIDAAGNLTFFVGDGTDTADYSALTSGLVFSSDAVVGGIKLTSKADHTAYTAASTSGRQDLLIDVEKILGTAAADRLQIKNLDDAGKLKIDLGAGFDTVDVSTSPVHGYVIDLRKIADQKVQKAVAGSPKGSDAGTEPTLKLRNVDNAVGGTRATTEFSRPMATSIPRTPSQTPIRSCSIWMATASSCRCSTR